MSREAMQMALEALEDANDVARMEFSDEDYYSEAINALRQALEIEPKALRLADALDAEFVQGRISNSTGRESAVELRRLALKQWVGLTDDEIHDLIYVSQKIDASNSPWFDCLGFYRAIEAKLKEKNQ
jgi:hypothetical protein